jgi:hypothetical protein
MKKKWTDLECSVVSGTAKEVLPRLNQILSVCNQFTEDLENVEILSVLKGVRQLDTSETLLLPESSVSESMKILQEFQQRPLDRDLLFERLRIKSLKEINDKALDS